MRVPFVLPVQLCSAAILASRERRCARPGRVLRAAGAVALRGPSARAIRTGSRRSSQRGRHVGEPRVIAQLLAACCCCSRTSARDRQRCGPISRSFVPRQMVRREYRCALRAADAAALACSHPWVQSRGVRPQATGDHVALGQRRRSRGARVERNRQRRWRTDRRCSLRASPAALAAFVSRALPMQSRSCEHCCAPDASASRAADAAALMKGQTCAPPDLALGARPSNVDTFVRPAGGRVRSPRVAALTARLRGIASTRWSIACSRRRANVVATPATVAGDRVRVPEGWRARARPLCAAAAAAHLRRTVGPRSSRSADSSPRQRVALAVALASPWDRARVHVRRALLLQQRALEGSSAALADPAARSHRADDAAPGAVRLQTTRLVLGRSRLLRLFCSDNEGVSKGTNNKNQTRKY